MTSIIHFKLKTFFLLLVLCVFSDDLLAQANTGIFFQAVARDNYSNPAKDRKIFIQSSIIQAAPTGLKLLTEEYQTITDAAGVFSISIGNGTRVGGVATGLSTIDWSKGPFYLNLKVAISPISSANGWDYTKEWVDLGTTSFGAVPFALYSASSAKVDDKLNSTDTTKMLQFYAKTLAVNKVENQLASKLNSSDTSAMLAPYANIVKSLIASNNIALSATSINAGLETKINIADSATKYVTPTQLSKYNFPLTSGGYTTIDTTGLSNRINLKANTTDLANLTSVLENKLNLSDTSILLKKVDTAYLSNRINLKLNTNLLGMANGVASLNALGMIPSSQFPPVTISSTSVVGNEAAMLALTSASVGSIAIRTDLNKNFVLATAGPAILSHWVELLTSGSPVQSVNGYTGTVNITKSDIGLSAVDNTSDINKTVSTATQNALNSKLDINKLGVASGVATLDALGKIPSNQIPEISFSSLKVVSSQAEMLALSSAVLGTVVIRTDLNKNFVLATSNPAVLSNWIELLNPASPVQSVNGLTGSINITKSDIGLSKVDNTLDLEKPISNATQAALDLKVNTNTLANALVLTAPLLSPIFTGVPLAPTAISGTNSSQLATTAFVNAAISSGTASNSTSLLSLTSNITSNTESITTANLAIANNLASINNIDTRVTSNTASITTTKSDLLLKAPIASPTFTGIPLAPTALSGTNTTQLATTSFVSNLTKVGTITTGIWSGTTIAVNNGGTGATSLTGYIKGNSTNAFTASVSIPSTDITGLIKKVNGSLPDANGLVTVPFGSVTTGTLVSRPTISGSNGNIYVVSGDLTTSENGRTYISDGVSWNEVTSNQAATDARYLQLAGGTLNGNIIIPTNKVLTITDLPSSYTDATNKLYVDGAISNITINDATTSNAGKILLSGDLAGVGTSSSNPKISSVGGSTAALINSAELLANAAVSTNTANQIIKRDVSGNFSAGVISANLIGNVTGNILGTATNVSGIVAVGNGGTGATTLTGYVKGNGTNVLTASNSIPSTDITGLIKKVNGTIPDADGNVAVAFGTVSTGTLISRPGTAGTNGNIYVVSNDATTAENGRTFISDGANWKEVTSNQSATDARYLKLAGGNMVGNITVPTTNKITLTDAPLNPTDAVNKAYVDASLSTSTIANTTTSTLGKIQLGGDLAGIGTSASSPIVSSVGGSTATLINSAEVLANASTSLNTANQIVKRDVSGNFSAGTITANVTGNVSGNAANVTGIVAGANGGTGVANTGKTITLAGNLQTTGSFGVTLTSTATTSLTLPVSGTLATTDIILSKVGTVTTGTWSATAIDVAHGGTNASTSSAARTNLGVAIGLDVAPVTANINNQTGTSYTLLPSDNGKVVTLYNGGAITLTIPTGLSAGFNCMIVQTGSGQVTINGSGVSVANRYGGTKTAGTSAIVTLIALTSTSFISGGDLQ